jgi:RNA polymerase sigma-70 factor (ECF subfamily)
MPAGSEQVTASIEDNDLVAQCQRGDAQAFDTLVTRYRGKTYAMIYNMVHNEQDAWDLAQDAFLKAWKSIGRFRGQSAFYTWLYRITTNVTIDWLRKKHIQSGTEFDDSIGLTNIEPGSLTTPQSESLPHEKMERAEIRRRINAAIDRLSPEHKAAILMREIDGLQYEEIAEALGCSIGTVMSRLFYARKKLQSMLKDVHENI